MEHESGHLDAPCDSRPRGLGSEPSLDLYICRILMARFSKGSMGGLGKDAVMRPPSSEEETSTPVLKPAKDKKRKLTSTSEDPKPKKNPVRKPKKDTVAPPADVIQWLREEEVEDEDDGSDLVARVKKTIEAPKAAESVVVEEIPPRAEGVLEKDSGKVPESTKIEDASRRDEQRAGMLEEAGSEALRSEENAPSGSLGAIDIGDSSIICTFFDEAIREAQAMRTPEVDGAHGGEDLFHGYFIGVEDSTDLSEASSLLDEAQQALNRGLALHQEAFSKFREELSRCEADLRGLTDERNSLKLLSRETLEEIYARSFDLTDEIIKAKEHEADARALASSDNDDYDGSKSEFENGEDLDGEEVAPEEN
uniref:Uncharacterized protein n=1 Tax=Nicotiana tabacum TaxID=4097 RepID=A0A1S3ZAG1_TOBAC|nr:PREDICTED: uncharacterized protein LOC107784581 [Nicotiana tabacum]